MQQPPEARCSNIAKRRAATSRRAELYLSASGSFHVVTTGLGPAVAAPAAPGGSGISAPSCSAPSVSADDGGVDAGDATLPVDLGATGEAFVFGRSVGTSAGCSTLATELAPQPISPPHYRSLLTTRLPARGFQNLPSLTSPRTAHHTPCPPPPRCYRCVFAAGGDRSLLESAHGPPFVWRLTRCQACHAACSGSSGSPGAIGPTSSACCGRERAVPSPLVPFRPPSPTPALTRPLTIDDDQQSR